MKQSTRVAAIAGAVLAATAAATATTAGAAVASPAHHQPGGVFVQTNSAGGNRVVVYDKALDQVGSYATGGVGGTLGGAVVDPLASQGGLVLDREHGLLYAVNAGSNTITVFGVHGDRLNRLQVIASGGTFPVSVAVHGDAVYVLNARNGGSVQGFKRIGSRLVLIPRWNRALGLDAAATPEFTHTPGQVAFTPDGKHLLVTTKANTNEIDVFAVSADGGVSAKPVRNVDAGAVPFAVSFDHFGRAVVAEAGPNAVATFDIHRDGRLTKVAEVATGSTATCWVVGADGKFYLANAGSATLTSVRAGRDGSLTKLTTTTAGAGTIDAAISPDGRTLYSENGGGTDGVTAFTVGHNGSLTSRGTATIPGGADAEGIAAF
ncbi:beta-propeller fold lactonase family protein [Actinoplanes sp. NPDC049596]|uniref:lactonase family protein n=1 Tax=unclassified Actinoplanes TaxID=2626549 RepID=UPI00342A34BB